MWEKEYDPRGYVVDVSMAKGRCAMTADAPITDEELLHLASMLKQRVARQSHWRRNELLEDCADALTIAATALRAEQARAGKAVARPWFISSIVCAAQGPSDVSDHADAWSWWDELRFRALEAVGWAMDRLGI